MGRGGGSSWPRLLVLASCACQIVVAASAAGQDPLTGTIRGVVRDSLGEPVVGAGISLQPGGRQAWADTAGRFTMGGVPVGAYKVRVRRVGFRPEETPVDVTAGDVTRVEFALIRVPPTLDTVVVRGERQCSRYTYAGFLCRQADHRGFTMTAAEIEAKEPVFVADIFYGRPEFRIVATPRGRDFVSVVGWRCVVRLVNGSPISVANPEPDVGDLFAVEVYQRTEVPPEYIQWNWRGSVQSGARGGARQPRGGGAHGPCTLVNFWTRDAKRK